MWLMRGHRVGCEKREVKVWIKRGQRMVNVWINMGTIFGQSP